ncbi:ATP-binding protein [Trueperella sp. LYQ143]|uniref:ATP-binding protein n=1 Tax=Trueperella sp. LYQ143 TaxID=3391059 RepID=UPI003982F745
MRRRAIVMTTTAVAVAVLILGIPGAIFAMSLSWHQTQSELNDRAISVASVVDRLDKEQTHITARLLDRMTEQSREDLYIEVEYPDTVVVVSGENPGEQSLHAEVFSATGAVVCVALPRAVLIRSMMWMGIMALGLITLAFAVGVLVALRQSRKISAPLIYLAAAAEQLGAGKVRPHIKKSGIEEIDLVNAEISRTAERMAGRLAAERQFAADAAHQLRTPLAALSMRIEEIEYLSDDPAIAEEVHKSLEQIDRLTGVVDELMATSQSEAGGTTEAVSVSRLFARQDDEWKKAFSRAGRNLVFDAADVGAVLATPGSLAQILATLIENSLKYGDGTTTVRALRAGKTAMLKVSDEGRGIDAEQDEDIFEKGYSTGGSTGIGLAVARELAEIDGGRLELTRRTPAEFTLTVAAVPISFDPDRILPQGAVLTVGARRTRR